MTKEIKCVREFTLTVKQFSTLNYILGSLQGVSMAINGTREIDIPKLQESIESLCKEKLEPVVMALRDQLDTPMDED